jgi:hypothetical protein
LLLLLVNVDDKDGQRAERGSRLRSARFLIYLLRFFSFWG